MDIEHVGCCNIHNSCACGERSDTKLIIPNMTLVSLGFWPWLWGKCGWPLCFIPVCSGRHWRNDSRGWADVLGSDRVVELSVIAGELWAPKKVTFTIVFNLPLSTARLKNICLEKISVTLVTRIFELSNLSASTKPHNLYVGCCQKQLLG